MRALITSLAVLLLLVNPAGTQQVTIHATKIQPTSWASGQAMYAEYCSTCHGNNGNGHGVAAPAFKVPVANLTTLAQRNGDKFPYSDFNLVMRFGAKAALPGSQHDAQRYSKDMPVWEPLFASLPGENESIIHQRIFNLAHYVAPLQSK